MPPQLTLKLTTKQRRELEDLRDHADLPYLRERAAAFGHAEAGTPQPERQRLEAGECTGRLRGAQATDALRRLACSGSVGNHAPARPRPCPQPRPTLCREVG